MAIELLNEYGGFAVGSVIEESEGVELTLINQGKARRSKGPVKEIPIKEVKEGEDGKPAKEEHPPKPLTALESMKSLRDHIFSLKVLMDRKIKSETDNISLRLEEILEWIDALMDDKASNPRSVKTIGEPLQKGNKS